MKGRQVTGFSNSEESAVSLTEVVPHLVEDTILDRGGEYSKGDEEPALARLILTVAAAIR